MKQLHDLLDDVRAIEIKGANPTIAALEYDSRRVESGCCFFAVRGTASDGHNYIPAAIERGAVAIVCQELPAQINDNIAYVVVEDTNVAMAAMAAAFYDHPTLEL